MLKHFKSAISGVFLCGMLVSAGLQAQLLNAQQAAQAAQLSASDPALLTGNNGGADFSANLPGGVRIGNVGAMKNPPASDLRRQIMPPAAIVAENKPVSEFQKFVVESTGKLLPVHGAEFFAATNSYAPAQGMPVPGDYPLGPGDEVLIRGWGSIDVDYRALIDQNGLINIPKVGTVSLAGVRAANAESVIRNAVGKYFRGFSLNVTLGQLRGMTVYVVGQAKRPGTYTLSSLSTAISALFDSGGPNANGSLRRIQVKRAGKQIAELDLYAFLGKGDKSADVRLLDGDVLVIPPAYGFVALTGKIDAPAIYELRGDKDTLGSLLEVAGGLPVLADPRRAFLERIDPNRAQPRSVEEFALDAAGLSKPLKRGDLLSVLPITTEFSNAVTVRGSVSQALRVPFREGMKVTDLIPSKEFLISRIAMRRQNQSAIIQSRLDEDASRSQFPEDHAALAGPGGGPMAGEKPQRNNGVERVESRRQVQSFVDSIGNQYDEINFDYAVIERLNRSDLSVSLLSFDLGKALADPRGADNLALQAGDTLTVFSANDVRIPLAKRRVFIRIEGEVRRPGVYQVQPGETLINLVERAGGLTADAYLFGSEFYRESVRKSQQENLDKFVRRLEQQGLSDSVRLAANASSSDPQGAALMQARLAAETESRKRLLQSLRELKSSGRITLGLASNEPSFAQLPGFRLENNDRLVVPNRPDFVQVFGAVNTEAALLWQPGKAVSDVLTLAGVGRDGDKDAAFVVRADGTVLSNTERWISSIQGVEVMPGDVIVVPEKLDKESFWTGFMRNAKDITQVLANFGIGIAAIHSMDK